MPVLVLTADTAPEVRHAALARRAGGVFTKPYDLHEVLDALRVLTAERRPS